ncbi:MAG: hypothetical protein KA785_01625 [Spirochaetaceae bacterium]|nr:hypothetical protein [Spirochaetaceae bacterium]
MKALIVAESESILSASSQFLNEKGCDVIKYRWLMKALDNLEEIDPQIIIISAMDYPRHWKTFVQFINSTYSAKIPHIFLFSSDLMGENEIRKATWLGVKGILKGFISQEDIEILASVFPEPKHTLRLTKPGLKNIASIQVKEKEIVSDPTSELHKTEKMQTPPVSQIEKPPVKKPTEVQQTREAVPAGISEKNLKIMFSNPHNNMLITGKVLLIKGSILLYICDNSDALLKLKPGDNIPNCMIKKDSKIVKKTLKILSINDVELKMEIQEWL